MNGILFKAIRLYLCFLMAATIILFFSACALNQEEFDGKPVYPSNEYLHQPAAAEPQEFEIEPPFLPHEYLKKHEATEPKEFNPIPTFLNLEFVYSTEVADSVIRSSLNSFFAADRYEEITWFQTHVNTDIEFLRDHFSAVFGFYIPKCIDFRTEGFITISIGRKLNALYYYEVSRYDTYNGSVVALPIFEREHYQNTIFVYLVTPLPRYGFICEFMWTDNFEQFNTFRNIPFEVWEHARVYHGPRISSRYKVFQLSEEQAAARERWFARRFSPVELEEHLHGYIVQDTFLRALPTRNTRVISFVAHGDEFIAYMFYETGESIDGNSRWYFVRAPRRSGFIHSEDVILVKK